MIKCNVENFNSTNQQLNCAPSFDKRKQLRIIARMFDVRITKILYGEDPVEECDMPSCEMASAFYHSILKYLTAPTIAFPDGMCHLVRRAFLSEVEEINYELFEWLEANRLRYNNLLALSYLPGVHYEFLNDNPEMLVILNAAIRHIPKNAVIYDDMKTRDQIFVTRDVAETLQFLKPLLFGN